MTDPIALTENFRRLVQQAAIAKAQAARLTYTCAEIRALRACRADMRAACDRLRDAIRSGPLTRARLLRVIDEVATTSLP